MSVFSSDRAAIAAALTDAPTTGVQVYDHVPGRAVAPCAMVLAGSPMVSREESDPFGSATAHYEVWVVAGTATNAPSTESIEDLVEWAGDRLTAESFTVDTVDQPFYAELNGTRYLASTIHITTPITFR